MSNRDQQLKRLERAARRTSFRLVLGQVLHAQTTLLPIPLTFAAGALTWIKVVQPPAEVERWLGFGFLLACTIPLIGAARIISRRRPSFLGAQTLDRHHDLRGRVSNALAFAKLAQPSPMMLAAIGDALTLHDTLSPRRAAPIRLPKSLWVSLALVGGLCGLSLLEVPQRYFVEESVSQFVPLQLPADDVELLRDLGQELQEQIEDPQALEATRRFNQLIEDIAERRLDRPEVFRRLEELEKSLQQQGEVSREGLEEGLDAIARELDKSGLSKPTAEALEQKNLPDAKKALEELSRRLSEQKSAPNKAELERLRKALSAASKQTAERMDRLEERRKELNQERERLLKKKNTEQPPAGGASSPEQRALDRNKRELKRLDRQSQRAQAGAQQLSKLDRELAQAAAKLMEEMGDAAKHLEQGAKDLQQMSQKQLSDAEKESLKKQLEALREMLRQNKGNDQQRQQRLERFRKMAKGQGQGQPSGNQGQQGQKQGKNGQGSKPGQLRLGGKPGQGSVEIPIPQGGQQQSAQASNPGQAPGAGLDAAKNAAELNLDDSKRLDGKTQDVTAAGIDSGEGLASSEVVYGAAERGFAGNGYRKIYVDYQTVAEEVLQDDQIPPGYKFYVRRYFQLIRPRD